MSQNTTSQIMVLKFGSSVLRTDSDVSNIVHEIYRWYRAGFRVVAVVSAVGDSTDRLLALATALSSAPEPYSTAELLATGERASAALLGVALDRAGISARVLNPREISLTLSGPPLDSDLVSVDIDRLESLLGSVPVLVVPGFFGTDASGRTHCLGRGGSDLTAVFLAQALNARVRLTKDVDGVYESDPAGSSQIHPRRYESLSYVDALRVAGPLIQSKAVQFLAKHATEAEVGAPGRSYSSLVYGGPTAYASTQSKAPRRLKVLLLGLGTVGFGVYQRLLANQDSFEVIGAVIRDPAKHSKLQLPDIAVFSDARALEERADVVVDALPGIEPSRILTERTLRAGVHVVSANKALIAEYGASLKELARISGATLRYSAAVGGATPMLEVTDRVAANGGVRGLSAVLNGTCNFILDACSTGAALEEAIHQAQRAGFAEADPTEDLSGRDAERKLRILCRHAFDVELDAIAVQFLDESIARQTRALADVGRKFRQVASAIRNGNGVRATVSFQTPEKVSVLSDVGLEWNALSLTDASGRTHSITGRGAGRWPTTEAVLADLFDLMRQNEISA